MFLKVLEGSRVQGRLVGKQSCFFYCSIVESTLLYGSECWSLTRSLEKRLQVFQRKCLRRILGFFYPNRISNSDLLERTGQTDMIIKIIDRKWRWLGHVARKKPEHLTQQSFNWGMDGVRRRGRP